MDQERLCAKCNKLFSSTLRYCPKCHTYWRQGKKGQGWLGNILAVEQQVDKPLNEGRADAAPHGAEPLLPDRYIICERCGKEISVVGDKRPDFCPHCNEMIDGETDVLERKKADRATAVFQTKAAAGTSDADKMKKKSPFTRVKKDDSSIAFIWRNQEGSRRLPSPAEHEPILIGKLGNYENAFFADPMFSGIGDRQARIYHCDTGWYIEALDEYVRLDNAMISIHNNLRLGFGSLLSFGNCTLSVEICERSK